MAEWNSRARFYHKFRRVFPVNRIYDEERYEIQGLMKMIPRGRGLLLDLGTGIGDSLDLLDGDFRKILLDSSLSMLSRAEVLDSEHKVIGRLEQLPVRNQSCDVITCIGVSEYVPGKALMFRQVFRALKPGGFALFTFSPKTWYSRLRNLLGKRIYPLSGSTAHDLIAAQGFFIVRVTKTRMQSQYLLQKL